MSLIFNFFDDLSFKIKIECIDCFCKHFKLNYSDTFVKLLELNHKDIPVWKLAQTFQLDLMQPTFDCEVVCRHVTTCDDQLDSIKKYGFLTLSEVLKKDTPLKKFLLKYGIEIDAEKKKMIIGEKEVEYSDKCDKCYMNENDDKQCFCTFHNELALLHNKLYYDKSEVEFF